MKLSVIIPTFNAEAFIIDNLNSLLVFLRETVQEFEVILVDDGSTDQTYKKVKSAQFPEVIILSLEQNTGKFEAIKYGMRQAKGNCCIFTDADIPYAFETILQIEKMINNDNVHIVIADRSLEESNNKTIISPFRSLFSVFSRNIIRLFILNNIFDSQAGLKGFRKDVAKALFPLLKSKRFSGDIELLFIALKYKLDIKPIAATIQRASHSTVKLSKDLPDILYHILLLPFHWYRGAYESQSLREMISRNMSNKTNYSSHSN